MQVRRLTFANFRAFQERAFDLAPRFNFIIGENGSGKTAFLDALKIAIGSFFLDVPEVKAPGIRETDIRRTIETPADVPIAREHTPVVVAAEGMVDGKSLLWSREVSAPGRQTTKEKAFAIRQVAAALIERSRLEEKSVVLPLLCYYGAGRLFLDRKQKVEMTVRPSTRISGYKNCFEPELSDEFLLAWFRTREFGARQHGEAYLSGGTVEGVRKAVLRTLGQEWERLYYDFDLDELIARQAGGEPMIVRFLSDGQRSILAMALDMAYRAATLNPEMGGQASQETPGVVLIDELDLYLHPNWQREIVGNLSAAFPKIQFITTTHSPLIIQSLVADKDCLINLSGRDFEITERTSPEDILKQMGVEIPQQSSAWLTTYHTAQQYYDLLEEAKQKAAVEGEDGGNARDLPRLRQRLDQLMIPFEENPAYAALLLRKRAAAGIDPEEEEREVVVSE